VEAPAASEQVLSTGTVLQGGAFVVEGVLGQGGFGITYKSRDATLSRTVALKEFFPQAQGCLRRGTTVHPSGGITIGEFREERNKFLEEGQRLAQFQHPSIVKVFSLFEENNTAYMVMEFLKGKTLLKMVEESGPLEERLIVQLIEQVAGALGVVHQANVLHRDVKPENVIVAPDNRAVLIDFGTAREFAAGKTHKMTTMLTPGYAPLEQYGQHARFGVFTDIYALGATTYQLLTGQVPIQATDRAAGVELAAPKRLNSRISRQLSDAVMWAMEMRIDKRPQSAGQFIQALRGARPVSSDGRSNDAGSSQVSPNPHQARITQVLSEIAALRPPLSSHQTRHDARIGEVTAELNRIRSPLQVLNLQESDCPICLLPTFRYLEGERSPQCPVCSQAQMKTRKIDQRLCPICREGHLSRAKLQQGIMFCPICRARSLKQDRRKRFGLSLDLWWVCRGCGAEFDVLIGGRAKLVTVKQDPFGVGKVNEGVTLPVSEWQQLSPLSDVLWTCDQCSAKLYELDGSRLCLDLIEHDPHDLKEKLIGKTYYRTFWAKLANGLSAKVGNTYCPSCNANFDFDADDKTLKLLACDSARFAAAAARIGKSYFLEDWSLFAAGKTSLAPGWLCSNCRAEFDSVAGGTSATAPISHLAPGQATPVERGEFRLIGAPRSHNHLVGEAYTFVDWHRRSRSLPTQGEEQDLKKELAHLREEKKREIYHLGEDVRRKKAVLEQQLQGLAKQSFIGAFVPLALQTDTITIKKEERVVWEGSALKLKQRTRNGNLYWDNDGAGILVVTNQRLIFRDNSGSMWSKPLSKLLGTNHEYVSGDGIVACWFDSQQKPVGLLSLSVKAEASFGDQNFSFELTSQDLKEVLDAHSRG